MKLLLLSLILSFNVFAQELQYITPESVDLSDIPSPPQSHSEEDLLDLGEVLNWQMKRTLEQCAQSAHEAEGYANYFFGAPYGPLSNEAALKLVDFQEKLHGEIKYFTRLLKKKWQRPRPYNRDPRIIPCIELEKSFAYPSGHTTAAFVAAKTYSLLYPDLASEFDRRAHEIALGRVIGGVHHPLDTKAGKKLAEVIFKALKESPKFLEDVEKLKK